MIAVIVQVPLREGRGTTRLVARRGGDGANGRHAHVAGAYLARRASQSLLAFTSFALMSSNVQAKIVRLRVTMSAMGESQRADQRPNELLDRPMRQTLQAA